MLNLAFNHEVHEAFQSVIKEFTDTQMRKVFKLIACSNPLFFSSCSRQPLLRCPTSCIRAVVRGLRGEMLFLGLFEGLSITLFSHHRLIEL